MTPGRGRTVEREVLVQACKLDVWLPRGLPADLTEDQYLVVDYEGKPYSSYDAYFAGDEDRWVHVHGDPEPHRDVRDKPRMLTELRMLFAQIRKGGTMVTVTTSKVTEDEFDEIVGSLVRLEP